MLLKVRIEVEEPTPESAVLALTKYEHAIQLAEVNRFGLEYTSDDRKHHEWDEGLVPRSFYNEQLGRELVEEVIEYDQTIPAYKARRVVRFTRIDTRSLGKHSMEYGWCAPSPESTAGVVG